MSFTQQLREYKRRLDIFDEVDDERLKQDEKWGVQNHPLIKWTAILVEEVGEVAKAILDSMNFQPPDIEPDLSEYRKELVQVAAVAISMIECYDRNTKQK